MPYDNIGECGLDEFSKNWMTHIYFQKIQSTLGPSFCTFAFTSNFLIVNVNIREINTSPLCILWWGAIINYKCREGLVQLWFPSKIYALNSFDQTGGVPLAQEIQYDFLKGFWRQSWATKFTNGDLIFLYDFQIVATCERWLCKLNVWDHHISLYTRLKKFFDTWGLGLCFGGIPKNSVHRGWGCETIIWCQQIAKLHWFMLVWQGHLFEA